MPGRHQERDAATILAEYTDAAIGHCRAIEAGSARRADRHSLLAGKLFRELRECHQEHRLLDLLSHPEPAVRQWSAMHCLSFAPEQGERVLRELADGEPGVVRVNAYTALRFWHDGLLKFD
jgi:hypothetical protein